MNARRGNEREHAAMERIKASGTGKSEKTQLQILSRRFRGELRKIKGRAPRSSKADDARSMASINKI